MAKSKRNKKIVYLFGAGATQGEIRFIDDTFSLLTNDVAEGIANKIDIRKIKILNEVKNELLNDKINIEHLITLYEATETNKHNKIATTLKDLFREEILERLNKVPIKDPVLFTALFDMHNIKDLNEELVAILTLNYDDVAEKAIQLVKNGINYSIKVSSKDKRYNYNKNDKIFPLIKLHGSFNWIKNYPITIIDQNKIKKQEDILWIPPGVEKKRDKYPFNILWSNAKDVLDCDILRVIGCSLNRNDWQLISLLFSMQKINSHNRFNIDMISREETTKGQGVKKDYPYLKIRTISEIPECERHLRESYGINDSDPLPESVREFVTKNNNKINIFEWWLRAKGNNLLNENINISTINNYFKNFVKQI